MLDNGSSINAIKIGSLHDYVEVNESDAICIGGITPETMKTLGTVEITIKNTPYVFHVVPESFPIDEDAILGRRLMREQEAVLSYYYNTFVLKADVMSPIPILTKEERDFNVKQRLSENSNQNLWNRQHEIRSYEEGDSLYQYNA